MKATATLSNYRQSPRKVRLVGAVAKGKRVPHALVSLDLLPKRASLPIKKLILSAVANATGQFNVEMQDLIVKNVTVDQGIVHHRWLPKARGRATPLRKKCSHVVVTVVTIDEIKGKKAAAETVVAEKVSKTKEEKPVAKKTTTKKSAPKTEKKTVKKTETGKAKAAKPTK